MKKLFISIAVLGFSITATKAIAGVKGDKAKKSVVDTFKSSTDSIKNTCGKTFTVTYDWKAYEAINWKKRAAYQLSKKEAELTAKEIETIKEDTLSSEVNNITHFGAGISKACEDADYKTALQKASAITYKPSANDAITVEAKMAGSTLTVENYVFGSTRGADDYSGAIKKSLD